MPKRKNPYLKWKKLKEAIRRTRLALGIPTTGKDWRGFAAEDKAEDALRYFKKKKLIKNYRRTRHLSPEDREGKDFIIELLNGKTLAVDVKNYYNYLEEKMAREKGIYLLVLWPDDDESIAKEKTLKLIVSAYLPKKVETVREIILGAVKGVPKAPKLLFSLGRILVYFRD